MSEREQLIDDALFFRRCALAETDPETRRQLWQAAHMGIRLAREVQA